MSGLRQRAAGAASSSSSSGGDVLFRRFKKLDIYRKVPRDLTEGSVSGGCVSLVAVFFLVFLALAELRANLQVKTETDIIVDKSEDLLLRFNLNVTLLGLACQFVHVEARNVLGVNREVDDLTLHKFALDQTSTWIGSATKKEDAVNHTVSHRGFFLDTWHRFLCFFKIRVTDDRGGL